MIADGAIAISGDRIEAVEKSSTLETAFAADETVDGRGLIAIPGLIDTNVATVQQFGRGAADLCDIPKFLLERVFAYEAALLTEDARAATCACQLEMIRSGTTCFVDTGSRFPEIVAARWSRPGCVLWCRGPVTMNMIRSWGRFRPPSLEKAQRRLAATRCRQ